MKKSPSLKVNLIAVSVALFLIASISYYRPQWILAEVVVGLIYLIWSLTVNPLPKFMNKEEQEELAKEIVEKINRRRKKKLGK